MVNCVLVEVPVLSVFTVITNSFEWQPFPPSVIDQPYEELMWVRATSPAQYLLFPPSKCTQRTPGFANSSLEAGRHSLQWKASRR